MTVDNIRLGQGGSKVVDSAVWLAAHFHMPSVYSCRSPISSQTTGMALLTPGPATVQQAMIRAGIESFGVQYVRNRLFQSIVASSPLVRPPKSISISEQVLRLTKADEQGNLLDGIGYRQMAQAHGEMIIYVKVDAETESDFARLLRNIGYWGQTTSFAYCTQVYRQDPEPGVYAKPIESSRATMMIGDYYTHYVTELSESAHVTWEKLVGARLGDRSLFQFRLYIWPLITCERRSSGQLLQFRSLEHSL